MNAWSEKSSSKLKDAHRDLIVFANEVLKVHDCTVVWTHRNETTQNSLYDDGKSTLKYPKSKHNKFPSDAIDLVPYVPELGGPTWDDEYSLYFCGLALGIADRLFRSGAMQYKIRSGLNWSTNRQKNFKTNKFRDTLHFELYRN